MNRAWLIIVLSLVLAATPARSATVRVPSDQPTIQQGLQAAQAGDTVLVALGEYSGPGNRDLSFAGKGVVLMSEQGASATTIFISDVFRAFVFDGGETRDAVVSGFTIRGAEHQIGPGGAVVCTGSSPTFEHCVFHSNFLWLDGGAIYGSDGSSPAVVDCEFFGNSALFEANGQGGAVCIAGPSTTLIEGCVFDGNQAGGGGGAISAGPGVTIRSCTFTVNNVGSLHGYSYGGAISAEGATIEDCVFTANFVGGNEDEVSSWGGAVYGSGSIDHCVFDGNFSLHRGGAVSGAWMIGSSTLGGNYTLAPGGRGGGIYVGGGQVTSLQKTIVWGNCAVEGGAAYVDDEGAAGWIGFTCCAFDSSDVEGPGSVVEQGPQVRSDPRFCDPMPCELFGGDYFLRDDSPCLPSASPCGELIGALETGCFVAHVGTSPAARGPLLLPGAPNPFGGSTTLRFSLPSAARARLDVYDVAGRLVARLVDESLPAGLHAVVWDGSHAAGARASSGVYLVRLTTGHQTAAGTVILMR